MSVEKYCCECKRDKPVEQFSKNKTSKDGLQYGCKSCRSKAAREYNASGKRKESLRRYRQTDKYKEHRAARRKTEKGKADNKKYSAAYKARNPTKNEARIQVFYAIRAGKMVRGVCEVCGSGERIEAHHDDYDRPLDVRWLCKAHHNDWHKENGAALNG